MNVCVRHLGLVDYQPAFRRMQAFAAARTENAPDEIWLLQHPPVYTLGLAVREGHLHQPGNIPVVQSDRGGQVTYHGPGQLIAYALIDLKRRGYGVRSLVYRIEQALIETLAGYDCMASRREGAPGIYVDGAKIAALGLRVKNGCSYHGLALNIDMDLEPFSRIDPCGYPGLPVTQLKSLGVTADMTEISERLVKHLGEWLQCASETANNQPTTMETIAHD